MQSNFDFGREGALDLAPMSLATWPPDASSLAADWQPLWQSFALSEQGQSLFARIAERLEAGARIFPPDPLRIFRTLALSEVRVVILGQDPYHGLGQAEGFSFSVPDGIKVPPSLRNIFKEIQRESPGRLPTSGHLGRWVSQGVLLLNTALTVEEGQPACHARWGWEALTEGAISAVAQSVRPVVFMLWGAHAQAKQAFISAVDVDRRHLVLQANHPSPLSALRAPMPFIGCGHFRMANDFLRKTQQTPIDW